MAVLPPDPIFCLKSDMGHIHSLSFRDDNPCNSTILLSATETGYIYFWDIDTNRLVNREKFGESIQCIHSIGNVEIITQQKDGVIKCFQAAETGHKLVKETKWVGGYCKSVLVHDKLVIPQDNGRIDVIHINTMNLIKTFQPDKNLKDLGTTMCLQHVIIDSHDYILAGFESGDIILWDYENSDRVCSHIKLKECITTLSFDSVNLRGICGNASNTLQIFQIDRQFNISLKCDISITNDGCSVAKLREDRKIFVAGGWDGRLRIFSWKSLRLLAVLSEHKGGSVTDIQYSPNVVNSVGKKIFAASGVDGIISLWNLYN